MTKILMFSGQIGSGKGFVSAQKISKLKEVGNTIMFLSFANPIKKFIDQLCGYDKNLKEVDSLENHIISLGDFSEIMIENITEHLDYSGIDFKNIDTSQFRYMYDLYRLVTDKTVIDDVRKDAIRKMYQAYGTDIMQQYNVCIWSLYLSKVIKKFKDVDFIVIDDWRFLFELFALISLLPNYTIEEHAIVSSKKIRAERRGISIEELEEQCDHLSEVEFEKLIMPWMMLRKPQNIIEN